MADVTISKIETFTGNSFNYTPDSGTDTCLVVVGQNNQDFDDPLDASFDGSPATLVTRATLNNGGSFDTPTDIYLLANPGTSAINVTSSFDDDNLWTCMTLANVHQTTPVKTGEDSDNTATSTTTISDSLTTSVDGSMIIAALGEGGDGIAPASYGSGQTERSSQTQTFSALAVTSEVKSTAGAETSSGTWSATRSSLFLATAAFQPASTSNLGSGTPQADTATVVGSGTASGGSTPDFKVQHISDDIANTGGTNTGFTAVGSLASAIELANNNRMTHAGNADLTSTNLDSDDVAGGRVLTGVGTLTYYRESASDAANMRFETSLLEYIGPSAGSNEFIVRGRYAVDLNGTTNSTTVDVTSAGISTAADCIPFITGIMNDATVDDADSGTALAYLESSTTLRVQKGSNDNNVKVYITLVEFTGSNWTVLHGDSGSVSADTGTITLRDGSDGTGTATDVSSWAEAVIFGQHIGDTGASGTNDAIADNWPLFEDGANAQSVDWTFDANHDSAGTNRQFVHVLNHADMAVTRYSLSNNAAGETTVNITSAGLSSLDQAIVVGSSISSGTGAAYGRGWRNYYFNSTIQAAFWCHRSGNTMAHRMQIVDFSGLVTSGGSSTTGSGTPQADTASSSGSGVNSNSGSGTLQASVATMSASGVNSNSGSGTPQANSASISGIGDIAIDALGSPQAEPSNIDGAGEVANTASGTPQAEPSNIDGEGTVTGPVDGSGTPQADIATIDGSGNAAENIDGSGSLVASSSSINSSGVIAIAGSGSPIAISATLSGLGAIASYGSGTPQAELGTIIGSGTSTGPIAASGTMVAAIASISSEGLVTPPITAVGVLVSDSSTSSGSGIASNVASGAIQAELGAIAGTSTIQISGSGTLIVSNATLTGSGVVVANVLGSGSLSADLAIIAGLGEISITGYSTMIAVTATMNGFGQLVVGQVPPDRIAYVATEDRIAHVAYSARIGYVLEESRTTRVRQEIRIGYVKPEDRSN